MQSSNVPVPVQLPFAADAGSSYIRTIPVASQIGITAGAASFHDGFPPLNFIPLTSGGIPPAGEDFNGVLNIITQWTQWQATGGPIIYNSAFATAIGGYPKGAVLSNSSYTGGWLCTTDNNTSNPDTGGSGWTATPSATSVAAIASEVATLSTEVGALTTEVGALTTAVASCLTLANFAQSFGGNGYTKLPNGLILQWGSYSIGYTETAVNFTCPFRMPA